MKADDIALYMSMMPVKFSLTGTKNGSLPDMGIRQVCALPAISQKLLSRNAKLYMYTALPTDVTDARDILFNCKQYSIDTKNGGLVHTSI